MTWLLWIVGIAFAGVFAVAIWFTVDTYRVIRHGKHVQNALNRDGR